MDKKEIDVAERFQLAEHILNLLIGHYMEARAQELAKNECDANVIAHLDAERGSFVRQRNALDAANIEAIEAVIANYAPKVREYYSAG